jgi:hypothetical protein
MAAQWSPGYHKTCLNTMICSNTCAFCTSYLVIVCVRNLENLQSSCRGGGNTAPSFSLHCGISHYLPQYILAEHLSFPTWMSTPLPPSAFWQSYHSCSKHILCNIGGPYYMSFCYPWPCTHRAKLLRNYVRISAILRIASVDYEFPNRKQFPFGAHISLCPNHPLAPPPSK